MTPLQRPQCFTTLFNSCPTLVVNSFYSTSQLKPRIQMLYQSRNTGRILWKYTLVLPLLAVLICLTAAREQLVETLTIQPGKTITASGRVVDANGKSIPQATVLIAGGRRGTPTDEEGRFTLTDVPTEAKLAVSSVGYDMQLLTVRRTKSLLVRLQRHSEALPTMGATAAYRAVGINKAMPITADPPDSQVVNGEVYTTVEQNAIFPDGIPGLMYYVAHTLRYPAEAQKANVQGTVFVKFVVTATGSVGGVRVVKGLGKGCNQEAVRVVRQMPRWNPAKQYGKPVPVEYVLPVQFALERPDKRTGQRQPRPGALDGTVGNLSNTHPPGVSKTETGGAGSVIGKFDEHLLYVLDNKPLPDKFDIADRHDIEGFELIPGQNAAKAYGVAGKSGVMHLHTKVTNRQNPEVVEALFGVVKQLDPTETDFRINGSTATNGEVLQLSTNQIRKVVINKDRNGPYGYVTIYTK